MDTHNENLEEDMKSILSEVPAPIHRLFSSGKVESVAKNLMQKNQLHIDQGAVLEREIILLLLGLKDPDEFTVALLNEGGIPKITVEDITKDVNEQIFIPLHEEMRNGAKPQQPPTQTAPTVRRVADVPPPAPAQTAPAALEESDPLPPRSALPQMRTVPPATVAAAAPPRAAIAPPASVQNLPKPEPSINKLAGWRSDAPAVVAPTAPINPAPVQSDPPPFQNTVVAPEMSQDTPKPIAQEPYSPPVARTVPPPPNLPGTDPYAPQTVTEAAPPTPIVKSYANDPYREPVDNQA